MFTVLALAMNTAIPAAAGPATPRVEAIAIPASATAVRAGGDLSDAFWQTATPIDAFVQREPREGAAPSQRTEFRVAYDATTLVVKVRAYDTDPDKIVTYLTRRDLDSPGDWIHVFVDSYHDRRTSYEFAVNPSGVKVDTYWFNDGNRDDSWDAVWDVSVSRDRQGWSAEFRIPFSQLRFTPSESSTFGFAVVRQIGRLNETATWPLLPRSASGFVSSFGDLGGLSMGASPKRLELVPYAVADLTRQRPDGNPLLKSSTPGSALGLDAKYALTSGLTLTATVNPDFGQVEADPAVVNLTAFETFFSERRPFFVEGSGTFNFGLDCNDGACTGLFYSRRIGRSPQGAGDLPGGDGIYTDSPSQSTILGAAKLTGRIGKFSIGVMQAVTQEERAVVLNRGLTTDQPVEPLTSYSVGRVRREFANQSSVGMMLTSTRRQLGDSLRFLPDNALTTGLDWDLRFKKRYAVTGYVVGSHVHGETGAIERLQNNSRHYFQRPGLTSATYDPTSTALNGRAGSVGISKIAGARIRFNSNVQFKTPGFDINDIGFMRRADQRTMGNWLQIRNDKPNRWVRSQSLNFNQFAAWNADGDRLGGGGNINYHANFVNNWSTGGGINFQTLGFDDRVTRGGPGVYGEGYDNFWSWFSTDNRKPVSLNFFTGGGRDGIRSWFRGHEISVTYRPIAALTVTSGVNINRSVNDSQWTGLVTDATSHYTFGRLNQTTVTLTERFNFTMTPNLSLQLYAQPFVSAGDYGSFKELANGRSVDYAQRYTPYPYDIAANGDPDFNVKSFRTTNVLRWEYKPGSTLFVVWQQARENDIVPGGFRFGRDVHDIFGVAPKNVFLVKLAYWLNY
jgi:hypothetical protein